jgi:hypothetical protein
MEPTCGCLIVAVFLFSFSESVEGSVAVLGLWLVVWLRLLREIGQDGEMELKASGKRDHFKEKSNGQNRLVCRHSNCTNRGLRPCVGHRAGVCVLFIFIYLSYVHIRLIVPATPHFCHVFFVSL